MNAKRERRPEPEHDIVTEAGLESFPASDPPSYNMPGRNARRRQPAAESATPTSALLRADPHDAGSAPARFGRIVVLVIVALPIVVGVLWLIRSVA